MRVEATGRAAGEATAPSTASLPDGVAPAPTMVTMAGEAVPLFDRAALPAGCTVAGPAILVDAGATTVVERDWAATISDRGDAVLRAAGVPGQARSATRDEIADPVRLELFNHRFMGIAEAMGVALQSTAASVNIKERLDFSCAIFDGDGALVANAPHMPVHLGSMGDSVAAVVRAAGRKPPGR